MKKLLLSLSVLGSFFLSAQFKIDIEAPTTLSDKKIIIYTLNGSKDILVAHSERNKGKWNINIGKPYKGMIKAFFPESNQSINFISENKNIEMKLSIHQNKIAGADFTDTSNKNWKGATQEHQKKEVILPILQQIKNFYNDQSAFDVAISKEIERINGIKNQAQSGSFLQFYLDNSKYASETSSLSKDDYKNFLINSGEMLESSSLMRPTLINFLKTTSLNEIDQLLEDANLETSRGQTILSELLTIFEMYGLETEKKKYYEKATALTCTINDHLKKNLSTIKNTSVGATFQDYTFSPSVKNTKVKKLSQVKANKKLVFFWSSTCPHCLSELPIILENYQNLKKKSIEIIGLSLDKDKKSYEEKANGLPWINDSELKGWQSSYSEKYNVYATPTYYVLDSQNKIIDKPANFSTFLSSIK